MFLTTIKIERVPKMKNASGQIKKSFVRGMLKKIVNNSMTVKDLTVARCLAFGSESFCFVNHETQGVSYHDKISLLVVKTGSLETDWLLENGFYLLGNPITFLDTTAWLIDADASELDAIKVGKFDTFFADAFPKLDRVFNQNVQYA